MYAIPLVLGQKSCDYNLEEGIRIAARDSKPAVGPQWGEARLITAAGYDLLVYHSGYGDTFLESHRRRLSLR